MCGIAGARAEAGGEATVAAMLDAIRHRGPDDDGRWAGADWCVGMRRLAIMDPGHGRQPMSTADGRWVLVYNGEIYNFRRLRDELAAAGATFATRTDTEVLLELCARRGVPEALARVEGMFAFAAVDTLTGDLWLARDRFGEKPLFIDRRGGRFAFCSELWPLLVARPAPAPRLDARGMMSILRFGHPWPSTTAIEGVGELEPGTWLRRTRDGAETTGRYWSPPDRVDEAAGSLERAGERLLTLLDESVRDRLVADVPLGLFLSGGIDSGAVASSAVRERPDVHAVTVGFDARGYDETPLARATASHLGVGLSVERGAIDAFSRELFDDLLVHHGQPFADTSAVPTRAVSREIASTAASASSRASPTASFPTSWPASSPTRCSPSSPWAARGRARRAPTWRRRARRRDASPRPCPILASRSRSISSATRSRRTSSPRSIA